ncbi:hypothetical protein RRG08_026410 [Elysia crispata]|uniref:Uncharacterized protein n=1 Tax=Elysia crispata TaxID=231223 RepID=A0AAE1CJ17_9GAST|nr:hypothetical protein RRG08_026410 [Elysia crispata]
MQSSRLGKPESRDSTDAPSHVTSSPDIQSLKTKKPVLLCSSRCFRDMPVDVASKPLLTATDAPLHWGSLVRKEGGHWEIGPWIMRVDIRLNIFLNSISPPFHRMSSS